MNGRQKILIELENLIYQAIGRAQAVRYGGNPDVNPHKIRNQYYSSIASLINAYARLSKDTELDDLMERLERLENDVKEDKE